MTHTQLTGAFIEIVDVVDIGTVDEVQTVLGFTTDDVELTVDEEEASAQGHAQRRTIRARTYNEAAISFSSFVEPTLETLDTLGIIDTTDDGKLQFTTENRTRADILLKVYADEEDADPAVTHRFSEVEFHMPDGVTYPSDFATQGIEGWIHGDIFLDYAPA